MPATRPLILFALVVGACSSSEQDVETQSRACLDGSDAEYHVRLQASGLDDHDGSTIVVVTEMNLAFTPALCRSTGAAVVDDGAIDIRLRNRTDDAVYPFVGAFVDLDDDGACTPGVDLTWGTWGSVSPGTELLLALEATAFTTSDELEICAHFALD